MAVEVTLRRIGNSVGFSLPKKVVDARRLKPNDRVLVEVIKEADLSRDFGSLKRAMSGQQFKDLVKRGWK